MLLKEPNCWLPFKVIVIKADLVFFKFSFRHFSQWSGSPKFINVDTVHNIYQTVSFVPKVLLPERRAPRRRLVPVTAPRVVACAAACWFRRSFVRRVITATVDCDSAGMRAHSAYIKAGRFSASVRLHNVRKLRLYVPRSCTYVRVCTGRYSHADTNRHSNDGT